jgi:hypothetical protein
MMPAQVVECTVAVCTYSSTELPNLIDELLTGHCVKVCIEFQVGTSKTYVAHEASLNLVKVIVRRLCRLQLDTALRDRPLACGSIDGNCGPPLAVLV